MVSFTRLLLLLVGNTAAVRIAVRDIAAAQPAIYDFVHCQKSCAPITSLAGACASESCLCPTVISKGAACVECLGTKNVTLAEEINETFQECIGTTLPGTLKSSDTCSNVCSPLFAKMDACKLSDSCVCSALESDTACYKCLLKNDPKTVTTTDMKALSKSCALPYPSTAFHPPQCDYTCLNIYLALDACLPDDYACLCASGQSTRRINKKVVEYPAFSWGSAACSKCIAQTDKTLSSEINAIQKVCGPPVVYKTVTSTIKATATTSATTKAVAKTTTTIKPVTSKGTTSTKTAATTQSSSASKTLYPRLIIPVQSSTPTKAYGTQYITTVDSDQEVVVVFDIPYGAKLTGELSFHLPGTGANPGSGTSAYTLSGSKVEVYELKSEVTTSLTYQSLPAVASDLGTFSLKEGSTSTLSSSVSFAPGTAVSIKLVSVGGTSLKWFEDYNAPAVGIILTLS